MIIKGHMWANFAVLGLSIYFRTRFASCPAATIKNIFLFGALSGLELETSQNYRRFFRRQHFTTDPVRLMEGDKETKHEK